LRFQDRPEYQRGAEFEQRMAAWLVANGWAVSRVRFGGDTAPTLATWGAQVILPDLQFMAADKPSGWLECKYNQTCGFWVQRRIRTTGFAARLFHAYQQIERVTGQPVWIAFGHRQQGQVRIGELRHAFPGVGEGVSMRYWDWDRLPVLAELADVMCQPTEQAAEPDVQLFQPPERQLALYEA